MTRMPVINLTATGQNIMKLRKQAGLSVSALQQIFGFSTPQAIYKWQRGAALPTVDNLVVLSVLFNTSINNILVFSLQLDAAPGSAYYHVVSNQQKSTADLRVI